MVLRGAFLSPLAAPLPHAMPQKNSLPFFFETSSRPSSPARPPQRAPAEGGLGAVPPSADTALPPGPLHLAGDSIPDLPNAAESWYPREAEPDSLDPAAS